MKKAILGLNFLLVLVLGMSCGGVPQTYFYRIDYEIDNPHSQNNSAFPFTLGISQLSTDILYESDKIVYRNSPYEVQFYNYRRWIVPPRKLVTEKLIKHYRASGVFARVVRLPAAFPLDYVLSGTIQAFEEWDEDNAWYGLVSIDFQLVDRESNEIVWADLITQKTSAQQKEPTAVVEAISASLNAVIARSIQGIKERLKHDTNI